jgi:hypothetical protein
MSQAIKSRMDKKKEQWIDLMTLCKCSTHRNNFMVFHYELPETTTMHYTLRVALRSVGHKITNIETNIDSNCRVLEESYTTTITEQESNYADELYRKYLIEISEEYMVSDDEECSCQHNIDNNEDPIHND